MTVEAKWLIYLPKAIIVAMRTFFRRLYKVFRILAVVTVLLCIGLPLGLYLALSSPWVQDRLRDTAISALTEVLGTDVNIGNVDIAPFNRLAIKDVTIDDDLGHQALAVKNISARFELVHFIKTGNIVIDYVTLTDADVTLYRKSQNSPLNIDGIIKRLSSKEPSAEPAKFALSLNTVVIENATFAYDVLDIKEGAGRFDQNHISVDSLYLTAFVPDLSNDNIKIEIASLSALEKSGLAITDLHLLAHYTPTRLDISELSLQLPHSALHLKPLSVQYNSTRNILQALKTGQTTVCTESDCYITPADLRAFVPALNKFDCPLKFVLDASVNADSANIHRLKVNTYDSSAAIDAKGMLCWAIHTTTKTEAADTGKPQAGGHIELKTRLGKGFENLLAKAVAIKPHQIDMVNNALPANINIIAKGTDNDFKADIDARTSAGKMSGTFAALLQQAQTNFDFDCDLNNVDIEKFVSSAKIEAVNANVSGQLCLGPEGETHRIIKGLPSGKINLDIESYAINGTHIGGLDISLASTPTKIASTLLLNDPTAGMADIDVVAENNEQQGLCIKGAFKNFDPSLFVDLKQYNGFRLDMNIDADVNGSLEEWMAGYVDITGFRFESTDKENLNSLAFDKLHIDADNKNTPHTINVQSDFINGHCTGKIAPFAVVPQLKQALSSVMPALIRQSSLKTQIKRQNDFTFEFETADTDALTHFFDLPFDIIHPVAIDGGFNSLDGSMRINIDAPYLLKGDKIIENTALQTVINGNTGTGRIYATTTMPTQKGNMTVTIGCDAASNSADTRIDWSIEREKPISGDLSFSTNILRDSRDALGAKVKFNPGDITFGNNIWHIYPATVSYIDKRLDIDHLALSSDNQRIDIAGTASADTDDLLTVRLGNINLISIFETLDINNALISGSASGVIYGSGLLGIDRKITTPGLHVNNIGYNYCNLGTGQVRAQWNNDTEAFELDADILSHDNRLSRIYGSIYASRQALDINIDADSVDIGFMKPFMSAFAADVTGIASGHARLFGTFKDINLEGDLMADSIGLKIAFTNTWYYASDSVKITPGNILIDNIDIRDAYGHRAKLNGFVRHNYFHEPVFEFDIFDAQSLLCYDVTPKLSPDWYGRIFGNGGARIKGQPGKVDIGVNMSTAQGSAFTFVLSDNQIADDFTFITFRDPEKVAISDTLLQITRLPEAVLKQQALLNQRRNAVQTPSAYNMDIQVDITPQAKIILVMDPIGGDEIKARGTGNLRMTYATPGDELHMYGIYTIDRGSYNFTLQDLIVKDFTIDAGSSIAFTGDPYAATLDIRAKYGLNANLSDLDESFLQDKELTRTNVPVNAILMAKGDMRQPETSFDLEFPTLNGDVYRKVRSIVSTEEMMNRQIIYLLALNRFYTPEYMNATRGNELFSVASSTITGQLGSILGKLSENWSISPNLRSDRGDFSDVEVDVMLSSSLLNNRLLLNGNFGYRDKSLNTNQFVGDFDIEYLLNRRGSWRLKAYNRYNDQNYYLRTAQTTQGVGIVFKRDFDNMLNFLKPRKQPLTVKAKPTTDNAGANNKPDKSPQKTN